jgi:hypothetical protein
VESCKREDARDVRSAFWLCDFRFSVGVFIRFVTSSFVFCREEGELRVPRMVEVQVEGSRFDGWNRQSESVNFATTRRRHTTGVLVFAGMNGNPIRGFLFNHVGLLQRQDESRQKQAR